jgi:hypothetical protein
MFYKCIQQQVNWYKTEKYDTAVDYIQNLSEKSDISSLPSGEWAEFHLCWIMEKQLKLSYTQLYMAGWLAWEIINGTISKMIRYDTMEGSVHGISQGTNYPAICLKRLK